MTNIEKAYMEGFSKVAEAHGVDPEALAKQAQWAQIGRLASKVAPYIQRGAQTVSNLPVAAVNAGKNLKNLSKATVPYLQQGAQTAKAYANKGVNLAKQVGRQAGDNIRQGLNAAQHGIQQGAQQVGNAVRLYAIKGLDAISRGVDRARNAIQ